MSEPCCVITQATALLEWHLLGRPDTEDKWEDHEARGLWFECLEEMAQPDCTPDSREEYQRLADQLRELF
jgi:hypothetical protein